MERLCLAVERRIKIIFALNRPRLLNIESMFSVSVFAFMLCRDSARFTSLLTCENRKIIWRAQRCLEAAVGWVHLRRRYYIYFIFCLKFRSKMSGGGVATR